jgi:hypothetical protein
MRQHSGLLLLLALYILAVLATVWLIRDATGGELVYGLDDPYIHMSIARTIVEDGTFGIRAGEASAAASSFLWPWMLAGLFALFGLLESIPLYLTTAAGVLVIWQSWRILRLLELSPRARLILLPVVFLLTPLLPMVFNGMETVLHAWATLLVFEVLIRLEERARSPLLLSLLGASLLLAVLLRYESMFLAAAIALSALLRRRYMVAGASVFGVLVALGISGLLYWGINGSVFPDSVLLKEHQESITGLRALTGAFNHAFFLSENETLIYRLGVMLLLISAALVALRRWRQEEGGLQHLLFVAGIAVAAQSIKVQHLYPWMTRYEIHLMLPGLLLLGVAVTRLWQVRDFSGGEWYRRPAALLAAFLLVGVSLNILYWGSHYTKRTVDASKNIHDQQLQMARFTRAHYAGDAVCYNDIGAASWYGGVRVIDLVGLASPEISALRQQDAFTNAFLEALVRREHAELAIVYDSWFKDDMQLPAHWQRAGKWRVPGNFICGDWEVSFYSTRDAYHPRLLRALRAFSSQLPDDVMEMGEYMH